MNNKGEVQFRVLSLVCLAVVIIASAWVYFSSPGSVLSRNQASFVSPDGLVNQDSKHPTSFGDADDLLELAPPPQALPAGSAVVTGHVSDAITGLPVANADVGISTGKKGIAAVYTTTGADGSYTFSNLADTSYNLSSSR